MENNYLELEVIKEDPSKRITLVKDIDQKKTYIKKELYNYDEALWHNLSKINNSYIPKIYSIDEDNHWLTIIEEYINAPTLEDILEKQCFDEAIASKIIIQLCDILASLHSMNPPIIHRDIKPGNVFYINGTVYLSDFDIARNYDQTQSKDTKILGSFGYAAPEQYGFMQTDARSDIYALGILFHQLLTRHFPNEQRYNGTFAPLIDAMIQLDPNNRPQNVKIVKDNIIGMREQVTIKKDYTPVGYRHRNPLNMVIATVYYIFCIYAPLNLTVEEGTLWPTLFASRVILFIMLILLPVFIGNYNNIYETLPFHNSKNKVLRIISVIGSYIVICFLLLCFATVFSLVLESFM